MPRPHRIFKITVVVFIVAQYTDSALRKERITALQIRFCDHNDLLLFRKIERCEQTSDSGSYDHYIRFHFHLCLQHLFCLQPFMRRTEAFIIDKLLFRNLLRNIMCQIPIRNKENMLIGKRLHNLNRICRSHADIRILLQLCRGIDVAHHCQILIFLPHFLNRLSICHMRHRTVRIHIRHQNCFFRIQHLGTFTHKRNSTEHDRLLLKSDSHLAEIERISDMIRYFLHFRPHIIVRQNDRIFPFLIPVFLLLMSCLSPFTLYGIVLLFCSVKCFL